MRPTVVTRRWMPERCGVWWVIPVWDVTFVPQRDAACTPIDDEVGCRSVEPGIPPCPERCDGLTTTRGGVATARSGSAAGLPAGYGEEPHHLVALRVRLAAPAVARATMDVVNASGLALPAPPDPATPPRHCPDWSAAPAGTEISFSPRTCFATRRRDSGFQYPTTPHRGTRTARLTVDGRPRAEWRFILLQDTIACRVYTATAYADSVCKATRAGSA